MDPVVSFFLTRLVFVRPKMCYYSIVVSFLAFFSNVWFSLMHFLFFILYKILTLLSFKSFKSALFVAHKEIIVAVILRYQQLAIMPIPTLKLFNATIEDVNLGK